MAKSASTPVTMLPYVDSNKRDWTIVQLQPMLVTATGDYAGENSVVGNTFVVMPALIEDFAGKHRNTPHAPPMTKNEKVGVGVGVVALIALGIFLFKRG